MNNLKLILIGLFIFGLMFLVTGCASAPICPEVTVKFCPVR